MRVRDPKRRGRDESGVQLVEFALIVPVLLMIIVGMLGFGRILFYWIEANHVANESVRWAVVDRNPHPIALQTHIRNAVSSHVTAVCIDYPADGTPSSGTAHLGGPVRVRVQQQFSVVPFLGIGQLNIKASAVQRMERFQNGLSPTAFSPANDVGVCS